MTTMIETKEVLSADEIAAENESRDVHLTEDVALAIEEASRAGKWCIAVAWIDDDRQVKRHRRTFNFPRADLVPFAQWLLNDLRGEAKMLPDDPLPVADLDA